MSKAKSGKRQPAAVPPTGNVRTTIALPTAVHALGHKIAKSERRSFSNLLSVLIEKEAKNGTAVAS